MKESKHTSNDKASSKIQVNNIFNQQGQDFKSILKDSIKSFISIGSIRKKATKSNK